MTPVAVHLRRTPGWRMPPNTRKVDLSTPYGNPFWMGTMLVDGHYQVDPREYARLSVEAFEAWLLGEHHWTMKPARSGWPPREWPAPPNLTPLRGFNLACWCPLVAPPGIDRLYCHREVLLKVANL